MNRLEAYLQAKILEFSEGKLETVTPSLRLQAFQKGRLKAELQLGKKYEYYDLASLTKIFFTTLVYMRMVEENPRLLNLRFEKIDSSFQAKDATPAGLLTHTVGLPWWAAFYKELTGPMHHQERWEQLKELLKPIKPEMQAKAVYSDVDFLFLGVAMEKILGQKLLSIWEELHKKGKLGRMHFNVDNKALYKKTLYAPTEDCPWRKKILQGEVHDDNTWSLGGVAPQAGLFGRIDDVSDLCLRLRKIHRGGRDSLVSSQVLKRFTSRKTPKSRGDWGYGFMLPTKGSTSAGKHFSAQSFGHTGFTGTSFWYDPKKDWLVVLLSNRVCPSRENKKFVELRPLIHNWIHEF